MTLALILTLPFGLLVWVDFFSVPDPLGMRQTHVHYYDPVAPMPDWQPWSCKYELVDAIRVCLG